MRMASSCAAHGQVRVQAGGRGEHLDADAVALHGLHDRVGGDLPARGAGDQRGQLAAQRHPLLDDQLEPLGQQRPRLRRVVQ